MVGAGSVVEDAGSGAVRGAEAARGASHDGRSLEVGIRYDRRPTGKL